MIVAILLIRSTAFQTWLGKQATDYYSEELGTKVRVDKVDLRNLRDMKLIGVYIEDLQGDTLIYAKSINADVKKYSFKQKFVDIEKIALNDGTVKIKMLKGGGANFDFIQEYFAPDETDTTQSEWQVNVLNMHLNNTVFVYRDENYEESLPRFDHNHIRALVNAHVSELQQDDDVTRLRINSLQAVDKSGFAITSLTGMLNILPGGFQIDDLKLNTEESKLIAGKFFLKGKTGSWEDYGDFFNNVKMYASFKPGSNLYLGDLSYFSEELVGNPMNLRIHGVVKGTVSLLKANDFYVQFEDNSYVRGDFDFDGLPDFENTFMALNIEEGVTNKNDLEKIELPPYDRSTYIELPPNMGLLGDIKFDGSFMGYYTDFVAYAEAETDMGKVKSDMEFLYYDDYETFAYTGTLEAIDFNLGAMYRDYGLSDFGKITANVSIDSAFGFDIDQLYADLRGHVDYFDLMGYRYKNTDIKSGRFEKDYFIGKVEMVDPNVKLKYNGKVDFSTSIPRYDFDLAVDNAHLYDLFGFAIDEGHNDAAVCFKLKVDSAKGSNLDNISGNFELSKFNYHENGTDVNLEESVKIHTGYYSSEERVLDVQSEILDLNFSGDFKLSNLEYSFTNMAHNILPTLIEETKIRKNEHDNFNFDLMIHDVSPIAELLDLNLSIYPETHIYGESDTRYGRFKLHAKSEFIEYEEYNAFNLAIDAESDGEILILETTVDTLNIDNFQLKELYVELSPNQEFVGLILTWDNGDENKGELYGDLFIDSEDKFDFNIFESKFTALNKTWIINNNAFLDYHADTITISDVLISYVEESDTEKIAIDGRISDLESDGLDVVLTHFKLENLNPFIGTDDLSYYGVIDGDMRLSRLLSDEPRFISELTVDSLKINETYVGDVDFESLWNNSKENITATGHLYRSNIKTLDFRGKYYPYRDKENLDFIADFKDTDLGVVNEFLPQDDITEFHAYTNGQIKVTGEPDHIKLNGELNFEEGQFKFVYLNTRYRFDGPVRISENRIDIKNMPISDEATYYLDLPPNGRLNGKLLHDNFEDLEYDLNVDFDRMLVMDTDFSQNPLFYGQAYGTGNVNVFGYGEKINISVIASTDKGTVFNLPLFGETDEVLQDFIRFVTHDSTKTADEYKVDLENITMTFGLDVTRDAEVRILFDPAIGDMMTGSAVGHLDMEINELGKFVMFGDLEVVEGDYLFTLYNVINKKFIIQPGGTIKWQSGDPYEAVVNITTNYKTRAPLYNLVALDDQKYEKKVDVNAFMTLKNDLYNPDLSFDIEVPKGDQNVEAALSKLRGDQEDMTKQFFALMVINNFVNQQPSGYGGAAITATSADLLNNQLSNWLSQMSDEFDIGFNYTPGDALSQQEVALAVGTQLLDDRLEVSGNFGYAQTVSQTNSALIGDFNVEYKINEEGTFRVRGFNETNDFDLTNAAQSRYTQGVGIYYTEDFDEVKDIKLFKKIINLFRRDKDEDNDVKVGVDGEVIKEEEEEETGNESEEQGEQNENENENEGKEEETGNESEEQGKQNENEGKEEEEGGF